MVFEPEKLSLVDILRLVWEAHDPPQGMGQGNDRGTQYRSALYYFDAWRANTSSGIRSDTLSFCHRLPQNQAKSGRLRSRSGFTRPARKKRLFHNFMIQNGDALTADLMFSTRVQDLLVTWDCVPGVHWFGKGP